MSEEECAAAAGRECKVWKSTVAAADGATTAILSLADTGATIHVRNFTTDCAETMSAIRRASVGYPVVGARIASIGKWDAGSRVFEGGVISVAAHGD